MLMYLYQALESFRSVFSRQPSGLLFCAVVLSFLAAPERIGVSSLCRFWHGDEPLYHRWLHFFRSKAYAFGARLAAWPRWRNP